MHSESMLLMSQFAERLPDLLGRAPQSVLDVGSFDVNGCYRPLFSQWGYVGLDIQSGPNVDVVVSDCYDWQELQPSSFDAVVSGQCIEHVPYPWETMRQIARVLVPGGVCCVIAPSAGPKHDYPTDCYRFLSDGMAALAQWAGLTVIEAKTSPVGTWRDSVLIARRA
jgi:SAM-dependent methyltransferase